MPVRSIANASHREQNDERPTDSCDGRRNGWPRVPGARRCQGVAAAVTGSCLLTITDSAAASISALDSLSATFTLPEGGAQPDNASIMVDFGTTPIP